MIMSRLPNLFIVGQAKAGTTSLHDLLVEVPEIYGNRNYKDYLFFSRFKGAELNSELDNAFADCPAEVKYRLDSGANYCLSPDALDLISLIPGGIVIWVIRDPVDRFISEYYYRLYRGRVSHSEKAVIGMSKDELRVHFPRALLMSNIEYQEKLIFERFPREAVFTMPFRDLVDGRFDGLLRRLNIDGEISVNSVSNKTSAPKFIYLNKVFFGNHAGEALKKLVPNGLRKKLGSVVRSSYSSKRRKEILKSDPDFRRKLNDLLQSSNERIKSIEYTKC